MSTQAMHSGSTCPLCGSAEAQQLHQVKNIDKQWYLVRCACGLHRTDPPPTAADLERFYPASYHTDAREIGGATESLWKKKYSRYYEILKPFLVKGRSLDVGCSTGYFVKLLKEKGFEAEGMEFNPASAAWGSEHYGIPIQVGTLDTIALRNATFDLISMTDVLEHTLDPKQTLDLVNRALVDGGFALITFPNIRSLESRYGYALARLFKRNWLWGSCNVPYHTWEFTPETAQRLFNGCGFDVVASHRSMIPPEFSKKVDMLSLPVALLCLPPLARTFGSQMEFVIRKRR